MSTDTSNIIKPRLPRISIEYCIQCRWALRAGWIAQELLVTFGNIIGEMVIIPGADADFIIQLNGDIIWNRKKEGRFPELKELKQIVRDKIAPEMNLGHSDIKKKDIPTTESGDVCGNEGCS
ncbi:hypothetical protein Glove_227g22 [Diversispora epigaea]|uniref:Uncharacterized protein n=1 Tax=Diversispora epigaea TaxID=1348612 RepID=A0A397IIH1_9GLOM|nr:hypothetical protein Glove_227g22 [Diversispora epigaea]